MKYRPIMERFCKIPRVGHRWDNFAQFKRRCTRCGVEEWVFGSKYPAVGEPAAQWRDMTLGRHTLKRAR